MKEVFSHPEQVPIWTSAAKGEQLDWAEFLQSFNAVVDFPGAVFWEDLMVAFPKAPVFLSTRESAEVWWASAEATIFRHSAAMDDEGAAEFISGIFGRFATDVTDKESTMAAYEAHNERVRQAVPADRLFEYQPGDGWAPLCSALQVPIPDEPFPNTNSRAEFVERLEKHGG